MALKYALNSGLWSSTSTWNGGTLPVAGDFVHSNGFVPVININTPLLLYISNAASTPAVGGGGFTFTATGGILNCSAPNGIISNTTTGGGAGVLRCTTNTTGVYNGNVIAMSGTGTDIVAITNTGGNLTLGNTLQNYSYSIDDQGTNTLGRIIHNASGTTTIYGTLGSSQATANTLGRYTLYITSGIVNVYGSISDSSTPSVTGRTVVMVGGTLNVRPPSIGGISTIFSSANNTIYNITNGVNIDIQGNVTSVGIYPAIYLTQTSNVTVAGNITCGVNSPAIVSNSIDSLVKVTGIITNSLGTMAIAGAKNVLLNPATTPDPTYWIFQNVAASNVQFQIPSGGVSDLSITNVRAGVIYNSGTSIGTMIIPSAGNVQSGVGVDVSGVGTLKMTPADFWNILTTDITTSGSLGERLKTTSTVSTLGTLLTNYNG